MFKQVLKIGLGLSLVASSLLATPEKTKLKIGFIALTDCAPIVIAKEKGFFAAEGLDVDVEKEGGGWPGIQQKTISGEYDFAHALAGLPIAATLGINGDANLQALLSLDYNGNAITLSNKIIDEMEKSGLRKDMSKGKVGALIVIEKDFPLDDIVRTGDLIDANINQRLIENIFFKNSPLHDGAMIISHKRIKAAGCILPVSHNLEIPKELGLRHRAALGVSQETDAMAIIVSEETGGISIAYHGQFHLKLTAEELERMLTADNRM